MKNIKILLFVIFGLWSYNLMSMEENNSKQNQDSFMIVKTIDGKEFKLAENEVLQSQTLYNLSTDSVKEVNLPENISSTTFEEIFKYLKVNENKKKFFFKVEERSIEDRVDLINALAYLGVPYNAEEEKLDNTLIKKVANSILDNLEITNFEKYKKTLSYASSAIKTVLIKKILLWMPTFDKDGKEIIQQFLHQEKLDAIIQYIKEAQIEKFQDKIEHKKHLVLKNIIYRAYITEKEEKDCITLMQNIGERYSLRDPFKSFFDFDEKTVTLLAKKISNENYMENRGEFAGKLQVKLNRLMVKRIIEETHKKTGIKDHFFKQRSPSFFPYEDYLYHHISEILNLKKKNETEKLFYINDSFIKEVMSMYLYYENQVRNISFKDYEHTDDTTKKILDEMMINQIISHSKIKASNENKGFFENESYKQYLNDNIKTILRLKSKSTRLFDINYDFVQEMMSMYLQHIKKESLWQKMYYELYDPYKKIISPLLGIGSVLGAGYLWQKYRKK